MKKILKKFLQIYLKLISKITLFIHKPYIIAIAGSTNKSFTKEKVSELLREQGYDVRSNIKSFNTEIGLPLAILALPSGYGEYKEWIPAIIRAPYEIFSKNF